MTFALEGIRILDLTDAVSGPFAAMILAGCGAEVIRVESRRHLGFRSGPGSVPQGPNGLDFSNVDMSKLVSPNFTRYNLDKLSVALNLTKPEGREVFKKLLKLSDIVIENLSFGVIQKWGLDYEALSKIKEDIIFVSMPSMGKGPHEKWTTWGMNLLSFTGFAYGWGHPDTPVEERAASNTYGDYIAGMKAATSAMAALHHRSKTGEGQYVEVSQTESTVSMLGTAYLDYFINNRVISPKGNRHPMYAPYNCYPCKGEDRWCVIAVFNEDEWQKFCGALGSPEWTKDSKFKDMENRLKNVDELDENVEKWTRQHTPHQTMKILQGRGIAAGAVQNSEDLYYDIQLRSRGHMLELETQAHGRITFDGPPVILSSGQKKGSNGAPILGEQDDYVYKQLLNFSQEEIEQLKANQVIF